MLKTNIPQEKYESDSLSCTASFFKSFQSLLLSKQDWSCMAAYSQTLYTLCAGAAAVAPVFKLHDYTIVWREALCSIIISKVSRVTGLCVNGTGWWAGSSSVFLPLGPKIQTTLSTNGKMAADELSSFSALLHLFFFFFFAKYDHVMFCFKGLQTQFAMIKNDQDLQPSLELGVTLWYSG